MTAPALELDQVSRCFGALTAVDQVSMTVPPGQIRGLIGPNGAGKSTLFSVIAGQLRASSGTVRVFGQDVTGWPAYRVARAGVARTFQATRPLDQLSVLENTMVGAFRDGSTGVFGAVLRTRRARREEAAARDRAVALIDQLGLADVADARPGSLTAGQRRLLEICRAVAARPRLLLLDEPAAGLNREETAHLADRLRALRDEGITCVLVEHDVELVLRLCDAVTVLDFGRVLAEGRPDEVRTSPAVIEAYLGSSRSSRPQHAGGTP